MGDSDQLPGAKDVERLPVGNSWAETDIFYLDRKRSSNTPIRTAESVPCGFPVAIRARVDSFVKNPQSYKVNGLSRNVNFSKHRQKREIMRASDSHMMLGAF